MVAAIWSPKNWIRKGAERFIAKILLSSTECFAIYRVVVGGGWWW